MFLHVSVILFTGGVPGQVPPGRYTPWQVHPGQVHPPWQVHPWQIHPWAGTPPGRYTPWAGTPPGQVTPQAGTPPSRYTPLASTHPLAGTPPGNACWDMVNKRAVRILLECILVKNWNSIIEERKLFTTSRWSWLFIKYWWEITGNKMQAIASFLFQIITM